MGRESKDTRKGKKPSEAFQKKKALGAGLIGLQKKKAETFK